MNSIALNAYARFNVYVPAVNGQLRQSHLTKKYPAFIRRMISTAFGDEPEARNALNYSDDEYNAPYTFLGGQISKPEDIMAILQKANLQELLKEENFRKQLYSWFENEKAVSASTAVRSLQIIPVWDTLSNAVRYVAFDGMLQRKYMPHMQK